MAGGAARQQVGHGLGVIHVVEHQEPSAAGLQPSPHRYSNNLPRNTLPQLEVGRERWLASQGGVVTEEACWLLASYPPHQVVVSSPLVGVFHRQLGLADPAKSGQGHPSVCLFERGEFGWMSVGSCLRSVKNGLGCDGTFQTGGSSPGNRGASVALTNPIVDGA